MGKIVSKSNGDVQVHFSPEEVIFEVFHNAGDGLVTVGRAMAHAAMARVNKTKYAGHQVNVFLVEWKNNEYIVTLAFREEFSYNGVEENIHGQENSEILV